MMSAKERARWALLVALFRLLLEDFGALLPAERRKKYEQGLERLEASANAE